MHARIEAPRHDYRCRLRERHGAQLRGTFTRWANSRFIHRRQQQPNGRRLTTTNHLGRLTTTNHLGHFVAEHDIRAIRAITAKCFPSSLGGAAKK